MVFDTILVNIRVGIYSVNLMRSYIILLHRKKVYNISNLSYTTRVHPLNV